MNDMQEIIAEFLDESSELIDSVMSDVMELEKSRNDELVNRIYRTFHSIKGNASMVGFDRLAAFAHEAEDVLYLIRKGDLAFDKKVADTLRKTLDTMTLVMDDIRDTGSDDRDTSDVIQMLKNAAAVPVKPSQAAATAKSAAGISSSRPADAPVTPGSTPRQSRSPFQPGRRMKPGTLSGYHLVSGCFGC